MNVEDLQTPTLLVHLDRVRANIAAMARWLGGDLRRWRPHVKTAKVPEVVALLVAAGVRRFKCATTREAEVLFTAAGATPVDLLMAMAQHGANFDRTVALAHSHPGHRVAMLSESAEHARAVVAAGLGVFVDLDPGYRRTGLPIGARPRIAATIAAAGSGLRGLHCYDGHLHDGTVAERTAAARDIYAGLCALARTAPPGLELITSGTPTFPAALAYQPFAAFDHVVSPGTVVYWDARSMELGIDGFTAAVEVQARVVSAPAQGRITLDAGSKALDAAAGDPCAVALGPWHLRALRPSEEHLPMQVERGAAPPLGTLLRLVPRHVCPTVNLADDAALLDGGRLLAVVPVRARGHETLPTSAPLPAGIGRHGG
jgi:D-serine deaminase-like pyridoxal phosphate-dependent protein